MQVTAETHEVIRPLQIRLPSAKAGVILLIKVTTQLFSKLTILAVVQFRVRNHWL
jgi:hypothetical protein